MLSALSTPLTLPRLELDDDDDGDDVADDDDDDDTGDMYIMMKCLSVCHEKSSLPPGSLL